MQHLSKFKSQSCSDPIVNETVPLDSPMHSDSMISTHPSAMKVLLDNGMQSLLGYLQSMQGF